jgi:hypothetical protein
VRPNGVIRFCWLEANGDITNWWSGDLGQNRKRFVHTQWGRFAVAVDLGRREAQIQLPTESHVIKFDALSGGETNLQLAFEAVCATGEHAAFAAELLLRTIGRDDLADCITKSGRPE